MWNALNIVLLILVTLSGCSAVKSQSSPPDNPVLRSADYVKLASPKEAFNTKVGPRFYQGHCVDHGEVTNSCTEFEKVRAAVDAHNERYHKGGVPKAAVERLGY